MPTYLTVTTSKTLKTNMYMTKARSIVYSLFEEHFPSDELRWKINKYRQILRVFTKQVRNTTPKQKKTKRQTRNTDEAAVT